jgi:hypothetical protein
MVDSGPRKPELTVGSLMGLPQGVAASAPAWPAAGPRVPPGEEEGADWTIVAGEVYRGGAGAGFRADGVEALTYSNPFGQSVERVWCDGRLVYAVELGEVDVDPERVKVAQEYQVVYAVELDADGKLAREPERVPGQYNIYDSVPGMPQYSPIWQFNYVIVPRDYVPNTLRSAADCLRSGYPIVKSRVFEN